MKKLLVLMILVFTVIISCKKDNKTLVCRIEGYVMNAETNENLDSVKVELLSGNQNHATQTTSSGYYNLGSFNIGAYVIVFSKPGYLKTSRKLDLTSSIDAGNYSYEVVNTDIIKLQPLQEKLFLTVYRKYQDGEQLAASNFPYSLILGDFNEPIKGQTDENGIINLNNMPRQVNLTVDYTLNGIRYKTDVSVDVRNDNHVVVYGYNPEASLGLTSTNVLDANGKPVTSFDLKGTISVQFTLPVDTIHSTVKLLEDGWQTVAYTHKWSNNNMNLVLTPATDLLSNTLYSLDFDIYNVSQTQNYTNLINFETKK